MEKESNSKVNISKEGISMSVSGDKIKTNEELEERLTSLESDVKILSQYIAVLAEKL